MTGSAVPVQFRALPAFRHSLGILKFLSQLLARTTSVHTIRLLRPGPRLSHSWASSQAWGFRIRGSGFGIACEFGGRVLCLRFRSGGCEA